MQRCALSKSSSSPSLTQLSWTRSKPNDALLGSVRSCSGGWTSTTTPKDGIKNGPTVQTTQQNAPQMVSLAAPKAPERDIFTFTASLAGAQGTQQVRCFQDRMLVTPGITLPFKQITHAELDGKSCSIKLHLGMCGISEAQQFPPGLLRMQLQNAADLAMLRQTLWPTLVRSLLRPDNRSQTRGPSLVWSHV